MNKTIILIAMCILCIATYAYAAGTVSIEFHKDHEMFRHSYQAVLIKTTDIDLSGNLEFTPSYTDNDLLDGVYPRLWEFYKPNYNSNSNPQFAFRAQQTFIGLKTPGNIYSTCIDPETKQYNAYLTATTSGSNVQSFTLVWAASSQYGPKYNAVDGFGSFSFLCSISTFIAPERDTLSVAYYTKDGSETTITSLTPRQYVSPAVAFKKAEYKKLLNDEISTFEVDIEFTTSHIGAYRLSVTNGPAFAPVSLENGKDGQYWCSSGSATEFARIQYNPGSDSGYLYIYVPTVPAAKQTIKCTLTLSALPHSSFVRSERTPIQLQFADVVLSRTLDYKPTPASFMAYYFDSSYYGPIPGVPPSPAPQPPNGSAKVSVVISPPAFSSTPLPVNSTMEFKFSKQFDLDAFIWPKSEYRVISCVSGNTLINTTVHRAPGSNIVRFHDFEVVVNATTACYFPFNDQVALRFDDGVKMASIEVKINGQSLTPMTGKGNSQPIYFRSQINIQDHTHTETYASEKYTIVDRFHIVDLYSRRHVTPTEPVLIFKLGRPGDQYFSHEEHASQLSCLMSTPTDTTLKPVTLAFDENTLSWSIQLKDIVNLEIFNLGFECTRTRSKVMKYGLEITPLPSLSFAVYDLIDGRRYDQLDVTDVGITSEDPIVQPTSLPSGQNIPPKPTYHIRVGADTTLKNSVAMSELQSAADQLGDLFTTAVKNFQFNITQDRVFKDFNFVNAGKPYFTLPSNNTQTVNWTAATMLHDFDHNILGNDGLPLPSITPIVKLFDAPHYPQHFSRVRWSTNPEYSTSVTAATTYVSQWITVSKSTSWTGSDQSQTFGSASSEMYWVNYPKKSFDTFTWASQQSSSGSSQFYQTKLPSVTTSRWMSPVDGDACGYVDGLQIRVPSSAPNYSEYSFLFADYVNAHLQSHRLCPLNATCKVNADCQQFESDTIVVCQASKCTPLPTVKSPFIPYVATIGNNLEKEYFNSATFASMSLVVVAMVLAFVF